MAWPARRAAACAAAATFLLTFKPHLIRAQGSPDEVALPEVVVTANRGATPLQRAGSAISVVPGEAIATRNPASLVDALRTAPGLDVTETGGPGAATSVRLRGANSGQTLVLLDGVRVNDPSGAAGEFDFSSVAPGLIERIEVLRGPQSALYGSDAIGGVVNLITRRGQGAPRLDVTAEAGQYGTLGGTATVTGSTGPWSYTLSGNGQRSDGFSRYGYRIRDLERRFGPLERDGFERYGGFARLGYDAGDGVRVEVGGLTTTTRLDYDAASGAFPDTPAESVRRFHQGWGRIAVDAFDGWLTNGLQVFANRTDRSFRDVVYRLNTLPQNTTRTGDDFIGDRIGAEYQGDLRLGAFGSLTFGGRFERETAETFSTALAPRPAPRRRNVDAAQETRSAFGLWRAEVGERLTLSVGGRVDDVNGVDTFATWRATAAYLVADGTKLRASAGTGAKAPTLFQLYAPTFGNTALSSERSIGFDVGVDQSILGDRARLSVTGFLNRITDLIEFDAGTSRYFNIARARTAGVEVAAEARLWPDLASLRAAYTYLDAEDSGTGLRLARRPRHLGTASLAVTPTPNWTVEPRAVLVSTRFNSAGQRNPLKSYARFDLYSEYRVAPTLRLFARLENLTDVRYQEVLNYGTTGRAFYGGIGVGW